MEFSENLFLINCLQHIYLRSSPSSIQIMFSLNRFYIKIDVVGRSDGRKFPIS